MHRARALRVAAAGALLGTSACTGTGLNAGEQGGEAFVVFTVMLVVMCLVLWLVLGRSE